MSDAPLPTPLAIATWNVHRCVGRDGREDPERVAGVIGELGARVVALQEVDAGAQGGGDQLPELARATGLEPISGPTLRNESGEYGNALLTALPVEEVRRFDLSVAGYEPRGALDVTLASPDGPLRVLVTHLGLARRERGEQVTRLLDELRTHDDVPTVLMGDLNEWWPRANALRRLRARFGAAPAPATFPARRPVLALDRIWAAPPHLLGEVRVHATPAARVASDHLPLRAELLADP